MTVSQRITRLGTAVVLGGVLAGLSAPATSADFDRGQALYERHCQSCHETWEHRREPGEGVVTLDGLRARVAAWSAHSGLEWSAAEIDDVTSYLNRHFYRLTQ